MLKTGPILRQIRLLRVLSSEAVTIKNLEIAQVLDKQSQCLNTLLLDFFFSLIQREIINSPDSSSNHLMNKLVFKIKLSFKNNLGGKKWGGGGEKNNLLNWDLRKEILLWCLWLGLLDQFRNHPVALNYYLNLEINISK